MPPAETKQDMIIWTDLMTTDTDGAKAFYSALFGWTYNERPTDMGTPYIMCLKDDAEVAGMGLKGDNPGPPAWNSYMRVDDIHHATELASTEGATLLMAPMQVMEAGHMSIVQDPTGAIFCLWEANEHTGAISTMSMER